MTHGDARRLLAELQASQSGNPLLEEAAGVIDGLLQALAVDTGLRVAALEVATYPPTAPRADHDRALVPWSRINALRSALDRCGIDWRT